MNSEEKINVWGARVHNLKNIDVEIPRDSLTVITGLSGSGKSSLAFDTIFAEGQRRYIETFSAYARNFLGNMERLEEKEYVYQDLIRAIDQKATPEILADICRDCSWFPISACCKNICSGRYVK